MSSANSRRRSPAARRPGSSSRPKFPSDCSIIPPITTTAVCTSGRTFTAGTTRSRWRSDWCAALRARRGSTRRTTSAPSAHEVRAPVPRPAPSSPLPRTGRASLAAHLRQIAFVDSVAELGDAPVKTDSDDAGGAVALLGDDHFRLAGRRGVFGVPLLVFCQLLGLVGRRHVGLDRLEVIILAIDEEHDVGVLLDRAGFTKIGELRPFVLALLDRTAELRKADYRHVEFLGELLQAAADL